MNGSKLVMTLAQLIQKLSLTEISDFITSQSIYDSLPSSTKDGGTWSINNDARSATFFSYGLAQEKNTTTVLIINDDELPSCYTGLTEAKLQHVAIIIVCIQPEIHLHRYISKCIDTEIQLVGEGSQAKLEMVLDTIKEFHSPVLFDVVDEELESKITGPSLDFLNNSALMDFDRVMVYEQYKGLCVNHMDLYPFEYRYGVLSKYLGFINGTQERVCLIAPIFTFDLDVNSLNCRYLDEKFKVILIDEDGSHFKHKNWVANNSIDYVELSKDRLDELNSHLRSEHPEIIYLSVKEN